MTYGDSKIFNGYVSQSMAGVEQEVANWVNQLKAMLSGTEGAADVARSAVQALLAAISANQVATLVGTIILLVRTSSTELLRLTTCKDQLAKRYSTILITSSMV